jgi:hypothetical protein
MYRIGCQATLPVMAVLVALSVLSCSTSCRAKSPGDEVTSVAVSGGPSIKPGKWKAKRTMSSAGGDPRTEDNLPRMMAGGGECVTLSQSHSGDKLTWSIECQMPNNGPKSYNKGQLVAKGDKASFEMEATTVLGAQSLTSRTSWEGKRVGDCD